jgi:hypothetical protein
MNTAGASPKPRALKIDRRTFIGALAALVAAGRPMMGSAQEAGSGVETGPAMDDILTHPRAAARLGRRYLADHPDERNARWLQARLATALSEQGLAPDGSADADAVAAALESLILNEYLSLPLQPVDGWLLAPSEARLYGLAAMLELE